MIKEKKPLLWETRLAQFSTGQQRTNSVWLWLWTRHYRSEVRFDWILSRSIWWSVIHLASSIIKDKDLLPRSFIRHLLYKEVPHLVSCSWPPQPPLITEIASRREYIAHRRVLRRPPLLLIYELERARNSQDPTDIWFFSKR